MMQNIENDLDYVLWNLLVLTRDVVYKAREKELVQYDITPEQAGALYAIQNLGDHATISKIGLRLMRKPHSVSNLLKRLEKYRLVVMEKSEASRGPANYVLTQKGYDACKNSEKRESLHKALAALSESEKKNLESYLRKIMDMTFKDIVNELKPPWP